MRTCEFVLQEGYHQALAQKITTVSSDGRPREGAKSVPGFEMTLLLDDMFGRVKEACDVNPTEFRAALAPPLEGVILLFDSTCRCGVGQGKVKV